MDKILTISIAAYNIEKYIRHTLEAFLIPDIMNEIEVIIVNDGSSDNTLYWAQYYERLYPGVFKVINKKNGGYGSTINIAVKNAHGKYFKTIDGDDWVDSNGIIYLVNYLKKCNDDMVVSNFSRINDKTGKVIPTYYNSPVYEEGKSFDDLYSDQEIYMQAITFKTEILKEMNLDITEHCFYTDIEYILKPIVYVRTISFLEVNVYMYRIAVNEQSMSVAGKRKHIDEQLKIYKKMIAYFVDNYNILTESKRDYFIIILAAMLKSHIAAILSLKINRKSYGRLIEIEKFTKGIAPEVYKKANQYKVIKILRIFNYQIY